MNRFVSSRVFTIRSFSSHAAPTGPIGFIGLGHMGSKMVLNLVRDSATTGRKMIVFDQSAESVKRVSSNEHVEEAESVEEVARKCKVIISMLPNDAIVSSVSQSILSASQGSVTHISCSTVSPMTSRRLCEQFSSRQSHFIAAPVFARPDGIAKRQATWMVAGKDESAKSVATSLLSEMGRVVDYGADVGASNVVKLCGNFLIASSIESISEAMALAEKHNVDRKSVMELLSSTIFDCLIYKGYGDRVSNRDHRPGGFSLALGLKDVSLVSESARAADVPMPFLSTLLDRYTSAKAKGRQDMDWSAIGLNAAEDAGIDISADLARNINDVKSGNTY